MRKSTSLRVRCPRCGETLWREPPAGGRRLAKHTSLALWHGAETVERTCQCGPLRIDAHQLSVDMYVARRRGQPYVIATEAVAKVIEQRRRVRAANEQRFWLVYDYARRNGCTLNEASVAVETAAVESA